MRKYILFRPHNDPSETIFFTMISQKKKFLGFLTWKRSCLICFHAWLQLDCVHNANGPSLSSYINLTIFRYVLLLPNWKWDHFRTEQMAVTTRRVVMGPSLSQDRVFWKAQDRYLEKGPSPRRSRERPENFNFLTAVVKNCHGPRLSIHGRAQVQARSVESESII